MNTLLKTVIQTGRSADISWKVRGQTVFPETSLTTNTEKNVMQ